MRGKRAKQLRRISRQDKTEPRLTGIPSEHLFATTRTGWRRADKIPTNILTELKEFLGEKFKTELKTVYTHRWEGPKRAYRNMKRAYKKDKAGFFKLMKEAQTHA